MPKKPLNVAALSYSVPDAAEIIGISSSTLYAMIGAGTIQCVRLGGRTLIRRADIDKLLESNIVGGA